MKYLTILLLIGLSSCGDGIPQDSDTILKDQEGKEYKGTKGDYYLYVEVVDSCEYVVCQRPDYRAGVSIIHKQNCKNHR